jgi:serine protease Do
MRKFVLICALILGLNLNAGAQESSKGYHLAEQTVFASLYENIMPAIVSIEADLPDGLSSGTGCIIDPSGLILTSLHVIKDGKNIEVTTASGQVYPAQISAILKDNNDLALIKINPRQKLPTVRFGDSSAVKVGHKVLAIGNPFGFTGTLTKGIVSRLDYQRNKVQTDAAINPGCSGGPLINLHGEVIGINQSIYNPDNNQSNIGIGFAVPINSAKEFISLVRQKNEIAFTK